MFELMEPFLLPRNRIGILLLLPCICGQPALAQYWAKDFNGVGQAKVLDVVTDAADNVYVAGEYSAVMVYDGQSLSSLGGSDAFVAKVDPSGALLWMKRAGGNLIDRATSISIGANGVLAVAGQYMGAADLFGAPVTGPVTDQNVFTASLNSATGQLNWVSVGGSLGYFDEPNDVAVSADGSVTTVGAFRGEAVFGSLELTSIESTIPGQASVDAFIAHYSPSGNLLWLQQGGGAYADRAVALTSDAQGHLFVCGQFSDTVAFDAVHNNALQNAIFILRLDPDGNELWFRKCGGASQNTARDILLSTAGDLLLCGDQQGDMTFFGATPTAMPGADAYSYFVMRLATDGSFLQSETIGSQNPVRAMHLTQVADTVALIGEFHCQFTGLADHYQGSGLFMAIGPHDLFVARHRFQDLSLLDGQQFAGHKGKGAGGIAAQSDGALVFGGWYQEAIWLPWLEQLGNPGTEWPWQWIETTVNGTSPFHWNHNLGLYCGDENYGINALNWSEGNSDGLLTKGYVRNRSPFDFWRRELGGACEREALALSIHRRFHCWQSDTIRLCDEVFGDYISILEGCNPLSWNWITEGGYVDGQFSNQAAPEFDVLWSTGDTTNFIQVTQGGWYWCTITSKNGCYAWTDSIYALPWDFPCPVVLSDGPLNGECPLNEANCVAPFTAWIENGPPDAFQSWSFGSDPIAGDTVVISETGQLVAGLSTLDGCQNMVEAYVIIDEGLVVPQFSNVALAFLSSLGDTLSQDTIRLCPGDVYGGPCAVTWFIDSLPVDPPQTGYISRLAAPGIPSENPSPAPYLSWEVSATESGWHALNGSFAYHDDVPCGTQWQEFYFTDSIYIIVPEMPAHTSSFPPSICPGDTLPIMIDCPECSEIYWPGQCFGFNATGDSASTASWGWHAYFLALQFDTLLCMFSVSTNITGPDLLLAELEPSQICPGDSALAVANIEGSAPAWLGDTGPLPVANDSIWLLEPGNYYYSTMDSHGCPVDFGPLVVDYWSSPSLEVLPDAILCPGEEVELMVSSSAPASVQWDPPLTGSAMSQIVTSGGLYTCTVAYCGLQLPLSAIVLEGNPDATVSDSGLVLCDGEQALLYGVPGQFSYLWEPFAYSSQSILVAAPGNYRLIVQDGFGCRDTSAYVMVNVATIAEPATAVGDTICAGASATLTAIGSGTLTWYPGAGASIPLGTGDTLIVSPSLTTTYALTQSEGPCTSDTIMVEVVVLPNGDDLEIIGPDSVCLGEPVALFTNLIGTEAPAWTTPQGELVAQEVFIGGFSQADEGLYTATVDGGPCGSWSDSLLMVLIEPELFNLGSDTTICNQATLTFSIPSGFSQPLWSTGSNDFSIAITEPGGYFVSAVDLSGCAQADTINVMVIDCLDALDNVISPNGDGVNDIWIIDGNGGEAILRIYNRWGSRVHEAHGSGVRWDGRQSSGEPLSDGVYFYELVIIGGVTPGIITGYVHLMR